MDEIEEWDEPEEDEFDFDEGDDEYDRICDVCGADLSLGYPEGDDCPFCLSCGGGYASGTEECDFCDYTDECCGYI